MPRSTRTETCRACFNRQIAEEKARLLLNPLKCTVIGCHRAALPQKSLCQRCYNSQPHRRAQIAQHKKAAAARKHDRMVAWAIGQIKHWPLGEFLSRRNQLDMRRWKHLMGARRGHKAKTLKRLQRELDGAQPTR